MRKYKGGTSSMVTGGRAESITLTQTHQVVRTCGWGSFVLVASIFSVKSACESKNEEGSMERGGGVTGVHMSGAEG